MIRRALAMSEKLMGAEYPGRSRQLVALGLVYEHLSDWENAKILYREALRLARREYGESDIPCNSRRPPRHLQLKSNRLKRLRQSRRQQLKQ